MFFVGGYTIFTSDHLLVNKSVKCPGHTFTDHLAGSTTDQITWMTREMTISLV